MSRMLRAALTQTRNVYEPMPSSLEGLDALADKLEDIRAANVEHHVELMKRAKAQGCQVIGFGELFPGPYFALEERALWQPAAEDAATGPTVQRIAAAARELELVVVAPIYELDPGTQKRFNTAVVISEQGEVLGRYRKTHIPCGTNERASFHETHYYERSNGELGNSSARICNSNPYLPVFETSVGRIGVAICYDRHFEGVMSALANGGAQLIFSPAVTFGEKSRRMWDLEFAVDAARHKVFIGGSNRVGSEPPWNVEFFGASHFVSPDGRLEDQSSDSELIISDLDLSALDGGDSSGWDLSRDRRPELFQ